MANYFVLVDSGGVFVKEAEFFREQGGLKEPWGEKWEPIEATSLIAARQCGIKMRRERFPDSHKQLEELGVAPENVWPEAVGRGGKFL